MSDRPENRDDLPEDIFGETGNYSAEEADKFINELLASKNAAEHGAKSGEWYDLNIGGDSYSEAAENRAEPELPREFVQPQRSAPRQESVPPQYSAPRAENRQPQPPAGPQDPNWLPEINYDEPPARGRRAEQYTPDDRDERPVRQSRRRKFGCLGGIMYFVFIIGISVVLAGLGWLWASDLLALGKEDLTAEIVLPDSAFTEVQEDVTDDDGNVTGTQTVLVADIDYVAGELKDAGLIKYKFLFKLFCSFAHADHKLDPGTYQLTTELDYRALVSSMQEGAGAQVVVKVTIPEGYTSKEIFALLEENDICSSAELAEAAANYEFDYDFLSGLEYGAENRLEGYLFPDTYEFYQNDSAENVLGKLLDNFGSKFTSAMVTEAQMNGYSMREILTIASLIEKEAGNNAERATIASVIYNRLNSSDYPYLNIDATVQYVLPERKEQLTYDDLEIDSPYNTYKYAGLPIGPIANPGLASIEAAITPESTGYYYYALNLEGTHNFFTNGSDFEAFINSDQFGG